MKNLLSVIILFFTVQAVLAAEKMPALKVALIHTFSKSDSMCYDPYGKNLLNGVEMAWLDFKEQHPNASFDIKFTKYELADDKLKAAEMIDKAIADNAIAAIGYPCSDFAVLGGERAQKLGIATITPTASDDQIADIGDYVFMAWSKNSYQTKVLSQYVKDDLKKKNILIIKAVDCAYCLSFANSFKSAFEKQGGTVVAEISMLSSDRSFENVVEASKKYTYDSILLANYAMQITGIIEEMLNSGIDTVYVGGDSWVWTGEAYKIVGNKPFLGYSVAGWIPEFPSQKSRDFVSRYIKMYGGPLVDSAAHSYDSAMFLFEALLRTPVYGREEIKKALYKTSIIDGVSGRLAFNGRNWPERSLIILKHSNRKQEIIKVINP